MEKETIFIRRSVREFNDVEVSLYNLKKLCKAGLYAPSAMNEQCDEYIIINDIDVLNKLRLEFPNSKPLKTCTSAIVVLLNKDLAKSELYFEDGSASVENILLYATKLGIGSCWIGIYPKKDKMDVLTKLFELSENHEPFALIALGYPSNSDAFNDAERYDESKVHLNKF